MRDAEPRRSITREFGPELFECLPQPIVTERADLMITGIGGTGIVTAAALIGMAAHLEGKAASLFDMTGLAQKNGAVCSHVRVAPTDDQIPAQRIGRGEADVLIAFDAVAALGPEASATLAPGRTRAVVNARVVPTVSFQFVRDSAPDQQHLLDRLALLTDSAKLTRVDATALTETLLGESVIASTFLLGIAAQSGLLPIPPAALEQAIRLNGAAIDINLTAFRLGRLHMHDEDALGRLAGSADAPIEPIPETLEAIVEHRGTHLVRYQNEALAARYRGLVDRVSAAERAVKRGSDRLAIVVARHYARLLAYKDEYEVARLLTDAALYDEIVAKFSDGAKLSFNLAAPVLNPRRVNGRPAKRELSASIRPLLRLLAKGRWLRGSWADPFGYTAERRTERALIVEYEALVERVLATLSSSNYAQAIAILDLADEIRGYGPVKAEAIAQYRRRIATAEFS